MSLRTSEAAIKLLMDVEGFSAKAYQDSGGNWTIGYGMVIRNPALFANGISQRVAETLLRTYIGADEAYVNGMKCAFPLTQQQFDAIIILLFNIGINAFAASQLKKCIEQGTWDTIQEWLKWDHVGAKPSTGLDNRRHREVQCFVFGNYTTFHPETVMTPAPTPSTIQPA